MASARVFWHISRRLFSGSSSIESLSCLRSTKLQYFPKQSFPKHHASFCTSSTLHTLQSPRFRDADEGAKSQVPMEVEDEVLKHPDYFRVSELFTMKDLFNAGVHYGHHEGCWNPLMKPYIYGSREHMHIIDLDETVKHMKLALNVLSHIVYRGGSVLFICTHPQFENLTQTLARDTGEYFVTSRWRGGTFTNSYMVLGTRRLPDAVVFLHLPSLGRNALAVKETAMCNIPSIGIVDSDCNPNLITYPIPGNDDSPKAMALYAKVFKEAILNAKGKRKALYLTKKKKADYNNFDESDDFY